MVALQGDGALVVAGTFSGVLVAGLLAAPIRSFYDGATPGALTLPQFLHLPYGIVVCAVVAMALIAFVSVERWERRA